MADGRTDESTGVVSIGNLKGDFLANACMKAETKAKRRVTLSIVGLGFLDESEAETIPNAQRVVVNETGEIIEAKKLPEPPKPAARPAPVKATSDTEAVEPVSKSADDMDRDALLLAITSDAAYLKVSPNQVDDVAKTYEPEIVGVRDASVKTLKAIATRLADSRAAKA